MDTLRKQLAQRRDLAILLIDPDHFKNVNDDYGHSVGDAVLVDAARKLKDIANQHQGTAVRLGGDEFCLLFLDQRSDDELSQMARMRSHL